MKIKLIAALQIALTLTIIVLASATALQLSNMSLENLGLTIINLNEV